MSQIVIVDDEPGILSALKRALRPSLWTVTAFDNPADALIFAESSPVDLVISDYQMPRMDGLTFLKKFRVLQPDAWRIVLSGQAELGTVIEAVNDVEIYRFLTKPWNDSELEIVLVQALEHREMIMENRRLADLVRKQEARIISQQSAIARLEAQSPGITRVHRDVDGAIILDDEDFSD